MLILALSILFLASSTQLARADGTTPPSQANLSEYALLQRCYASLTRSYLAPTNPLAQAVKAGSKTGIQACESLLDSTSLQTSGATIGRLVTDTSETRAILRTFNDLHRTWFPNDSMMASTPIGDCWNTTVINPAEAPLHVTRALFTPNAKYSDIVTATNGMEDIRTNGSGSTTLGTPTGTANVTIPQYETGDLIGIRPMTPSASPDKASLAVFAPYLNQNIPVHQSYGGGILGTPSFLLLNMGRLDQALPDGGLKQNRRWSRAVFNDLLCRDVPVIRPADADVYVETQVGPSTPPFRPQRSCMACHASMDSMAAISRNFTYAFPPDQYCDGLHTFTALRPLAVTQPRETGIVDMDSLFYARPPNGTLIFRNYNGDLVRQPVSGLGALGNAIASQEDFYACAASRYVNYFTGIQVTLSDPGDPSTEAPSASDTVYQNWIVQLAKQLQSSQNIKLMIKNILENDLYKKSSMRNSQ